MAYHSKLVGVIGGMGPEATIDFMACVLRHTDAASEQQHVRMLVEQNPHIPSRQSAMRGEGEDPGAALSDMAARLQRAGADFIVMPCNLAHAWQGSILAAVDIPFVSIVTESVGAAMQRSNDGSAIGLLTTPGCFSAGLYQEALATVGRPAITQTSDELSVAMNMVNRIKAGDHSKAVRETLVDLGLALIDRGADVIIAACTEFPLLLRKSMFDVAFVSTTDVLAKKTVALAKSVSVT